MKTFEGVNIQSINLCPSLEYSSGLRTKLFYAPASFFLSIELPTDNMDSYEKRMTINEIEFKGGEWGEIDILIDNNELKALLGGNVGKKKVRSELAIYILGLRAEILGFLDMHIATPFVFAIQDANGNNWILGNLRNRAFISEAELSSGKKYEDLSGALAKITCNSSMYLFKQSIKGVERAGGFTKGFSFGFK